MSGAEIAETLLRPLTDFSRFGGVKSEAEALSAVLAGQVYGAAARECRTADEAAQALLGGCCLLVFDGLGRAAAFETKTDRQRAIAEPASERALKGARDSFTETLRVNTALVVACAAFAVPACIVAMGVSSLYPFTPLPLVWGSGAYFYDEKLSALIFLALLLAMAIGNYIINCARRTGKLKR